MAGVYRHRPQAQYRRPVRVPQWRPAAQQLDGVVFSAPPTFGSVLRSAEGLWQARSYSGSGNWLDEVNSHDATLNGGVTFHRHGGTQYLYLPDVSGNWADTPDSAALSITGDIDIRARVTRANWDEPDAFVICAKAVDSTNRGYIADIDDSPAGEMRFQWTESGGTSIVKDSSVSLASVLTDGQPAWLRWTLDVDNGASGNDVKFWYSTETTNDPDAVTWTQLGTTQTTAGTTDIEDNAAELKIGWASSFNFGSTGDYYRVAIYNGIGGTKAFDADFTDTTALTEPFTSFTEKSSNAATVTIDYSGTGAQSLVVDRDQWWYDTDSYHEVADDPGLDFAGADSFTVMALIRAAAYTTNACMVAKKNSAGTVAGWALMQGGGTGELIRIADGAVNISDDLGSSVRVLHDLAGVRNTTDDDIEAFVDGTGTGSPTTDTTTATLANARPVRFGANSAATPGQFFQGSIMAVAVWRSALTDKQIVKAGTELKDGAARLNLVLDGVLLSKPPTFPAGTLSVTVAGVLFSKPPTFPAGEVSEPSQTLDGVLLSKPPSFPAGQINLNLTGVVLSKPASFPAGTLSLELVGVLFSKPPAFPVGALSVTVSGVLFSKPPTFPVGALLPDQQIDGVLFSKPPTFPVGALSVTVAGVVFAKAPAFPAGTITQVQALSGVLFAKAPAFPAGQLNLAVAGVLFAKPASFPAGALIPDQQLDGVLFSKPPTFPAGSVAVTVAGVLFSKPPTFPAGTLTVTVAGVLFSKPATFPAGSLSITVTGVLFSKPPTFPAGSVSLSGRLDGVLFSKPPSFPAGQLNQTIAGVLFSKAPTFPAGTLTTTIAGVLFSKAPAFPAGQLDLKLTGVLFAKGPAFVAGSVDPQAVTVTGVLFSVGPAFPVGTISAGIPGQRRISGTFGIGSRTGGGVAVASRTTGTMMVTSVTTSAYSLAFSDGEFS